jgi:hypothetical protein
VWPYRSFPSVACERHDRLPFALFFKDVPSNHVDNGGLGRDDGFSMIIVIDGCWRMDAYPPGISGVVPYGAAAAASILIRGLVSPKFSQILRLVSSFGDFGILFMLFSEGLAPPITPSELSRTIRGNDKK